MPKVRTQVDEYELRITPPDQQRITEWHIDDKIQMLLSCEEGGEATDKKLHYHCIIKTTMSRNTMVQWIYKVSRSTNEQKGNAVFFSRQPHAHSYGYVIKEKRIVCRHGIEDRFIEEWFTQTDSYKRQGETSRKDAQRKREQELGDVVREAETSFRALANHDPHTLVELILRTCSDHNIRFPAKTQMESIVLKIMYKYDHQFVTSYYMRSFPFNFNHY